MTMAVSCTVSGGALVGSLHDGIASYLGVPYAAPLVGERRFALPEPCPSWTAARPATSFGATAPQAPYPPPLDALLPSSVVPGDDYLNVNVWAPAAPTPGGYPVLVWFHGGALTRGANSLGVYDGAALARKGLVVVCANYRLGAEGFSVLEGAPRNVGLWDQLAALRWVQEEVAAFGGDASRVTIAGQSSGGTNVAALMVSPRARGLLHRAIVMSGPVDVGTPESAAVVTTKMARRLRVAPTRAAFLGIPPEQLLKAQTAATGSRGMGGSGFQICVDGDLVPLPVAEAIAGGAADDIPVLAGTTTEELRLYTGPGGKIRRLRGYHLRLMAWKAGLGRAGLASFRARHDGLRPGELLGVLLQDVILRAPLVAAASSRASRGASTWLYEFAWKSPIADLGAAHGVDLPFAFDTVRERSSRDLIGDDAPQALADRMSGIIAGFVRGESLDWPSWGAHRRVRVLSDEGPGWRDVSAEELDHLEGLRQV